VRPEHYIGDGVYVSHDGYQLWLTTERDGNVVHAIALEPQAWRALVAYVEEMEKGDDPR
jgi:hypothetical protein